MTTVLQSALLVDLHPASDSDFASSHAHLIKNKINSFLTNDQATYDVIQLYFLTSLDKNVSKDFDTLVPNDVKVKRTVVRAEDRIGSFYQAKMKLDALDVTEVKVVCAAANQRFWEEVCQLLLTPVHNWDVETASCSFNDHHGPGSTTTSGNIINGPQREDEEQESSGSAIEFPKNHQSSFKSFTDPRSKSLHIDTASVRNQIQRYLQTLPSLLGLPEVTRSELLPKREEGFVHGFSTRRGGVTVMPTLCAMNLIYTVKKRDSQLVVDENRRRLASVGGFDHQNYHLVKVEHGHRVWVVEDDQPPRFDALVTNRPDVTIAAAGADCIPLLFSDPVAMVIGAAHAGWKGTVERVAACVVRTMKERFGSRPEDIRVAMGPGVRLGCFVVLKSEGQLFADIHPSCLVETVKPFCHRVLGPASHSAEPGRLPHNRPQNDAAKTHLKPDPSPRSITEVSDKKPVISENLGDSLENGTSSNSHQKMANVDNVSAATSPVKTPTDGFRVQLIPADKLKPKTPRPQKDPKREWAFVDLQLTNYHVLLQEGVKAEHIDMSTSHCTKCNPDLYFSYDRDGFPFGNQIGFICMPSHC